MNEVATVERSPLSKFDENALKGITSRDADGGASRALFQPSNMAEAMEVAKLMAAGNFIPPHLRGKPGDCLAVVMQSARWAMDPFAVGNKTYFVNDRMAYESQLVNAVVNSSNALDGRLSVSWEGEGNDLVCVVSGKLKGDADPKVRRVPIKTITTRNSPLWKQDPEQQLAYYATRAWARLFAPEVLMGVYTPDELAEVRPVNGGEVTAQPLTADMLIGQAEPRQTIAEELDDEIPALKTETDQQEALPGEPGDLFEEEENDALIEFLERVRAARDLDTMNLLDTEWKGMKGEFTDDEKAEVENLMMARRKRLPQQAPASDEQGASEEHSE